MTTRVLLYLLAFFVLTAAYFAVLQPTEKLRLYNARWGPAVAQACLGQIGVLNLSKAEPEARKIAQKKLAEFLNVKPVPTFDCATLPAETQVLSYKQGAQNHLRVFLRYQVGLHWFVGVLWGLFGVSWTIVGIVASMFAAGVTLVLFNVANRFLNFIPAIALTTGIIKVDAHVYAIPFLRDYGKVFFVLLAFSLLWSIVMHRWTSRKAYYGIVALYGLFLGISVTFRQDMEAIFALSLGTLLFFPLYLKDQTASSLGLGRNIVEKITPSIILAIGFFAITLPLYLTIPVDHAPEGHFINLGLTERAFDNAGWSTGDITFNPLYRDYSAYGHIIAYVMAVTGENGVTVFTEAYNKLSISMFFETMTVFPLDLLGRGFSIFYDINTSSSIAAKSGGKGMWLLFLIATLSLYFFTFFKNRRLFFFLLFFFMGSSYIVSIQYIERHYLPFHLLWLTVAVSGLILIVSKYLPGPGQKLAAFFSVGRLPEYETRIPAWYLPATLAGIPLLFLTLFTAQHFRSNAWMDRVMAQETTLVSVDKEVEGKLEGTGSPTSTEPAFVLRKDQQWFDFNGESNNTLDYSEHPLGSPTGAFLEFRYKSANECGQSNVGLWMIYKARVYAWNLTHLVKHELDQTKQSSRFLPVFFSKDAYFHRLMMNKAFEPCFEGAYWVHGFPNIRLPIGFSASRQ